MDIGQMKKVRGEIDVTSYISGEATRKLRATFRKEAPLLSLHVEQAGYVHLSLPLGSDDTDVHWTISFDRLATVLTHWDDSEKGKEHVRKTIEVLKRNVRKLERWLERDTK